MSARSAAAISTGFVAQSEEPVTRRDFFSSRREIRLWQWTAVVLGGIYATLAFSSLLTNPLYNQTIAAIAFLSSMVLIGASVLFFAFKASPGGVEVGIGVGIAAVYLMVLTRATMPERSHLIEYSVLAVLLYEALLERRSNGRNVRVPAILAVVGTAVAGAMDEGMQILLPERVFDPEDIVFNAMAGVAAVSALALLRFVRLLAFRRRERKEA